MPCGAAAHTAFTSTAQTTVETQAWSVSAHSLTLYAGWCHCTCKSCSARHLASTMADACLRRSQQHLCHHQALRSHGNLKRSQLCTRLSELRTQNMAAENGCQEPVWPLHLLLRVISLSICSAAGINDIACSLLVQTHAHAQPTCKAKRRAGAPTADTKRTAAHAPRTYAYVALLATTP